MYSMIPANTRQQPQSAEKIENKSKTFQTGKKKNVACKTVLMRVV